MTTGITPYLNFDGRCAEALNFYISVLGGKIESIMRMKDAPPDQQHPEFLEHVMHARATIGGTAIMASDGMGQSVTPGLNVYLSLDFASIADIEKAYHAMKEGGHVVMELQDTFWGARFAMLRDRYGINWMFNWDKK